jgi:hypothetical protein
LDQLLALCRNNSVPKEDEWVSTVLEFLLLHGFFNVKKADKKGSLSAVSEHTICSMDSADDLATLCPQTSSVRGYRCHLSSPIFLLCAGSHHGHHIRQRWV